MENVNIVIWVSVWLLLCLSYNPTATTTKSDRQLTIVEKTDGRSYHAYRNH